MPFVRFSRDKRGYEHTYLIHAAQKKGASARVLYWYRTPPGVRVGRPAFDDDVRRALESQYPHIDFDWPEILNATFPVVEVEHWRERRRAEKAAKQARQAAARDDQAEPQDFAEAPAGPDGPDDSDDSDGPEGPEGLVASSTADASDRSDEAFELKSGASEADALGAGRARFNSALETVPGETAADVPTDVSDATGRSGAEPENALDVSEAGDAGEAGEDAGDAGDDDAAEGAATDELATPPTGMGAAPAEGTLGRRRRRRGGRRRRRSAGPSDAQVMNPPAGAHVPSVQAGESPASLSGTEAGSDVPGAVPSSAPRVESAERSDPSE